MIMVDIRLVGAHISSLASTPVADMCKVWLCFVVAW